MDFIKKRKIKETIFITSFFSLFGLFILSIVYYSGLIPNVHESYNTIYSEYYTEENFNKIQIGFSEDSVRKLLGEPIKKIGTPFFDSIGYSTNEFRIKPFCEQAIEYVKKTTNFQFVLFLVFDENGNVKNLKEYTSYYRRPYLSSDDNKKIDKIINKKKSEILSIIGMPNKSMYLPEGELWLYSDCKKKIYGKVGSIYNKRIFFTNGYVCKRIDVSGSVYSIEHGMDSLNIQSPR